MAAYEVNAT